MIIDLRFLCFLLFNSEFLFMVSAVQERWSWLIAELRFDGRFQKFEEVALLFSASGQSSPHTFVIALTGFFAAFGLVISLEGGFDDVDESFVALAKASSNSATLAVSFAICSDYIATSFRRSSMILSRASMHERCQIYRI